MTLYPCIDTWIQTNNMPTFQINHLSEKEAQRLIGEFYDSLTAINNREDVRNIMRDLLTPNEIAMLARRIQVAILLSKGYSQREISENLNVGLSKVLSVKKSIERHGDGYRHIIDYLQSTTQPKLLNRKPGTLFPLHPDLKIWKSIFDTLTIRRKQ